MFVLTITDGHNDEGSVHKHCVSEVHGHTHILGLLKLHIADLWRHWDWRVTESTKQCNYEACYLGPFFVSCSE